MKVISTNIAKPRTVEWRGRKIQTGIYKEATTEPIFLGKEDVANDALYSPPWCFLSMTASFFWERKT